MRRRQDSRTGIRDAFRAVHVVSRLVGLAPYTFVTNSCNKRETIDISWEKNIKFFILSLVMLSIQIVGFIYVVSSNFIQNPNSLSELVAKTLQLPLINATGLVVLVLSVSINRKRMLMIIEQLSIVDKCLFQNDHTTYKKHNRVFKTLLILSILYHIILHSVNTYFHPRGHVNLYYSVSICLCDFVWAVNDLGYVNVVEILATNLIAMNRQLDTIFVTQYHSRPSSDRYRRDEKVCFLESAQQRHNQDVRRFLRSQINNCFSTSNSGTTSNTSARILDLRICYNKLYRICRLINSMYGFTLLMEFMAYTVCIIGDVYITCCMLITPFREYKLMSISRITTAVLWTVASALKAFSVVFASDRANSEFKKSVGQIQKLILYVDVKEDMREQLELFSIQLSNNRIEFTACGFFTVNFKLVRSIVYTVVTYIIVLVQVTWFKH